MAAPYDDPNGPEPPPNSAPDGLEISGVRPSDEAALGEMLEALAAAGDGRWFRPHPLTRQAAAAVCRRASADVYALARIGGSAAAYGMLRGWAEGHPVPSLGLAVAPAARRTGLGRAMAEYLHCRARLRGAASVRLRVRPGNAAAAALYESLGYRWLAGTENGMIVGVLDLRRGG